MKATIVVPILIMTVATAAHADKIPTAADAKAACAFGGAVVLRSMELKDEGNNFDQADHAVRAQLVDGKPNRENLMMSEQILMLEVYAGHFAGESPKHAMRSEIHECVENFSRMYPELKW